MYGNLVFETFMPLSTDYKVAVTSGTLIAMLKPRSAAAKAMMPWPMNYWREPPRVSQEVALWPA